MAIFVGHIWSFFQYLFLVDPIIGPAFDIPSEQVIMPGSIIDWTTTRAMAGTSSFGFSGTNSHGTLEAPKNGEGRDVPLERPLECTGL